HGFMPNIIGAFARPADRNGRNGDDRSSGNVACHVLRVSKRVSFRATRGIPLLVRPTRTFRAALERVGGRARSSPDYPPIDNRAYFQFAFANQGIPRVARNDTARKS